MNERTYLAVPYDQREEAKALGARWDQKLKAWYAPDGVQMDERLTRWLPDSRAAETYVLRDKMIAEFAAELAEAGIKIEGMPDMDGKFHRGSVDGDKSWEKSGSYRGWDETLANGQRSIGGWYKNYRTGDEQTWFPSGERSEVSPEVRAALSAQAALARQERDRAQEQGYENAAKIAQAVFGESQRASSANPYCREKGMSNPGAEGLRVVPATFGAELSAQGVIVAANIRQSKEIRKDNPSATIFLKGDLLVPAYDMDGELWSVQSVNTAFKSFMRGGRKSGMHTLAGAAGSFKDSVLAKNPSLPIIVCEGRATGDSLARVLGHPVVVAFDAGNLRSVALALRQAHPDRVIVIAGDNDHAKAHELGPNQLPKGNQGVIQARAVAQEVRGGCAIPSFEPGDKGSDWNDLAKSKGLPRMRRELIAAIEAAVIEAKVASIQPQAVASDGRQTPRDARAGEPRSADDPERPVRRSPATRTAVVATLVRPSSPVRDTSHER